MTFVAQELPSFSIRFIL